ncbi:hypothetical protein [Nocardia africana]
MGFAGYLRSGTCRRHSYISQIAGALIFVMGIPGDPVAVELFFAQQVGKGKTVVYEVISDADT